MSHSFPFKPWSPAIVFAALASLALIASGRFLSTQAGKHSLADDPPTKEGQPGNEKAGDTDQSSAASRGSHSRRVRLLAGRVVDLAEAMERLHGVPSDHDATGSVFALETDQGRLHPILKDIRGRAFHKDERLLGKEMVLRVKQFDGTDVVQVMQIYTVKEGKFAEFDYWCDTCAIAMFELKDCECCQGPIRFRERPVKDLDLSTVESQDDESRHDSRDDAKPGTPRQEAPTNGKS